ncbi:hypothetical protein EXIGLDRAFT_41008 [Exidia glandulosa HHB12029]|uniref:Uncharacterized protein n=1 Tax=Exidia glandulosa HHB12029 TaxID=1314781 RepID=A0A165IMJ2_EXIGL|nr:hypothetical protein EXIGLDRAFT_41008 [Exidia glandulosa HHB12029]
MPVAFQAVLERLLVRPLCTIELLPTIVYIQLVVNYVCSVAVLLPIRLFLELLVTSLVATAASRYVVSECPSVADPTAVVGPGHASQTMSSEHGWNLTNGRSLWSYEGRDKVAFPIRSHFATVSDDSYGAWRNMRSS